MLIARHGREDFTITPQQQMLDVLGSVLDVLTFAVGALGGISLLVGGVGILTIMTIAVAERTAEIGLLRALGAQRRQILLLFLGEAALLAAIGGVAGLALGWGIAGRAQARAAGPAGAYAVVVRAARRSQSPSSSASPPACCRRAAPRASIRWRRCAASSAAPNRINFRANAIAREAR